LAIQKLQESCQHPSCRWSSWQ